MIALAGVPTDRLRRWLASSHDDGAPELVVLAADGTIYVSSPRGYLTSDEDREVRARYAAWIAGGRR